MIKYIIKRLLLGILVLFGVTVITFSITHLLPSDPARSWAGAKATEEQVEAARIELGLDRPVHEQFLKYLADLSHGDLGVSYTTRRPITTEMSEAIPATLELVFYAIFIGVLSGVVMGVLAAKYKNRLLDHLVRLFAIGSASIPSFVFAMVLQLIFFQKLHLLPLGGRLSTTASIFYTIPHITGWLTIDSLLVGNFALFKDALIHLILPAIPIAVYPAGTVARMTRSSLVEVLNEDYIMAARSYGMKEGKVLWKCALKNTVGTTATVTALSIGYTLVTELSGDHGRHAIFYSGISDSESDCRYHCGTGSPCPNIVEEKTMLNREILRSKWKELKLSMYLLNRNMLTRISIILLILLIVSAFLAPVISPHPQDAQNATNPEISLQGPSQEHLFGTDELGRDILSKTIYGIRISLSSALITVFFAMVIGTLLGAVAGTVGGVLDEIIMRITDIFLSFPSLLLAIVISAFLEPSLQHAQMAMVISWWPWYTRIMRGEAISIKERQYIKAADTIGTPRVVSIFKHIIPNGLSPIIIQASQDMGAVVLTVASLGFLGLGAQPPTPEWGLMVSTSKSYFMNAWWYTVFPGAAIFITVLIFNVIGDGLREVLDPKTRKI